jgi:hypothetical protein
MTNALTTQTRSLAIPESCLFSPAALSIPAAITKEDFQKLGAALVALDTADGLWTCDLAHFAITRWGKEEGGALACTATGYTKSTCKKLAYIAERFTPEHRPDGFTRAHFKALLPFPQDWLNTWVPTVANRRLSAKGIRALAVEQFGSDPSQRPSKKTRAIHIQATIFEQLRELNQTQPSALAEAIITAWLGKSPEEQSDCLAVAAESKRVQKNERQRKRNAKKAEREAEKAAIRDKREAEALARKAERQAFYEAEAVKKEAEKLARKAAEEQRRAAKKKTEHCAKIAAYTASQGKPSQWLTKEEADAVIVGNTALESYSCDCGQYHIRKAQRSTEGLAERDGNDIQSAQPHPETSAATETHPAWNSSDEGPNRLTYAERRRQQIASGAGEPIPAKA